MKLTQTIERVIEEILQTKPMKRELMRILYGLFEIYSPSRAEQPVVDYCVNILNQHGFNVIVDEKNNIIASRGKFTDGDTLVCINAHTDTVQHKEDMNVKKFILYDWVRDTFHTRGRAMLGGDDKCGVAVALTLAAHTNLPMKIILTTGEEVGSTGAHALDKKHLDDVAFTFTVDRMHGNDLISEYCGLPCAPDTFVKKFIEISDNIGTNFKESGGSYADTYILCKYKPAVNLSSGYYNPHSRNDFVVVEELYKVMLAIKNAIEQKAVLEQAIAQAPSDWQKSKYKGFDDFGLSGGYGGRYGGTEWGGGWYGAVDAEAKHVRSVASGRGVRTRATHLVKPLGRYGGTYQYGTHIVDKCKINYGKSRGFDDKELKRKRLPPAESAVTLYSNGSISDNMWENLLSTGTITKHEYQEGIDLKVGRKKRVGGTHIELRTREERLSDYALGVISDREWSEYVENGMSDVNEYNEGIARKHEEFGGIVPTGTSAIEEPSSWELIESYANGEIGIDEWDDYVADGTISPEDHAIGIDERKKTERYRKAFDQGTEFGELAGTSVGDDTIIAFEDASEKLARLGIRSGYQTGSVYDMIFTQYAVGEMSDEELDYQYTSKVISDFLYDACKRAKINYMRSRKPSRIIETTGRGKIYEWGEETEMEPESSSALPKSRVGSPRERLAADGFKSGFAQGTDEDDIFIGYMIGELDKMDLWEAAASYVRDNHPRFVKMCIDAKEEFDDYIADMELQNEWNLIDMKRSKTISGSKNKSMTGVRGTKPFGDREGERRVQRAEQKRINKSIRKSARDRNDIREILMRRGFKSGFNAGDPEDEVFLDYISGKVTKWQLSLYPYDYVSFCIKAKEKYIEFYGNNQNTEQGVDRYGA